MVVKLSGGFRGLVVLVGVVLLRPAAAQDAFVFLRGDADQDRVVGLNDALVTLNYLFLGGAAPAVLDAADTNDDGALNVSDPAFTLSFLYLGTAQPPAPGPYLAGTDPTPDALGFGLQGAVADGNTGKPLDVTARLVQPETPVLPGAKGELELDEEEREIEVDLDDLVPGAAYRVELRDADGTAELLVEGVANDDCQLDAELKFAADAPLPFGATTFHAYVGFAVVVLDADNAVILAGVVPPDTRFDVEANLIQPAEVLLAEAEGEVGFHQNERRRRLEVELENLLPKTMYRVELSDGGGTAVVLAEGLTDRDGDFEQKLRFEAGAPLPFDVLSFSEYVGYALAVLDADGAIVLVGVVPADSEFEAEAAFAQPETPVVPSARGEFEIEEDDDEREIEVELEGLAGGAIYRIELRGNDGATALLAEAAAEKDGDLEVELEFVGPVPLPLDVASFREYVGFHLVVLDADGAVVLEGTVPAARSDDDRDSEDGDRD